MKWILTIGLVMILALGAWVYFGGEENKFQLPFGLTDSSNIPPITKPILSSGGVEKTTSNSLSPELENQLMGELDGWTQNGSEVYFEDNRVYISATDRTNQPIVRLTSKQYSGDINLAFGFNTQEVKPTKAEYYHGLENVTHSYTCENLFNYTLTPQRHFWCYRNVSTGATNSTPWYTVPIFDHDFEWGNISAKKAYWTSIDEKWTNVNSAFDKQTFFLNNTDTWYLTKNFTVNANQTYQLKLNLQPKAINTPATKYWIAFWPSSETISQAIQNDHFYALDPWTEALTSGLVSYYKFDEQDTTGTGIIKDSRGLNNGTNDGADNVTGKINTSYDFVGANTDLILIGNSSTLKPTAELTFGGWFAPDADSQYRTPMSMNYDASTVSYFFRVTDSNYFQLVVTIGGVSKAVTGTTSITPGTYYNVYGRYNTTHVMLFVNGVEEGTRAAATGSITYSTMGLEFGSFNQAGTRLQYYDGDIDEIGIWNRSLTNAEITQLYNSGAGITYGTATDAVPNVTLNSPVAYFNSSSSLVTFNCTATDDIKISNVSLIIDNAVDQTNTSGINNSNYIFTKNFATGQYNWTCNAIDNKSQSYTPTVRIFNVTIETPTVVLQSPVNTYNSSTALVTYSALITTPTKNIANVSLIINGSVVATNTSNLNNTVYSFSHTNVDGNAQTWNVQACNIDNDCATGTQRTFSVDTINPVIYAYLNTSMAYNFGDIIKVNYTLTETNPHTCWYNYNNINTTFACSAGTFNIATVAGKTNITVYANDTVGRNNSLMGLFNVSNITSSLFNGNLSDSGIMTNLDYNNFTVLNSSTYLNVSRSTSDEDGIYYSGSTLISMTSCPQANGVYSLWTLAQNPLINVIGCGSTVLINISNGGFGAFSYGSISEIQTAPEHNVLNFVYDTTPPSITLTSPLTMNLFKVRSDPEYLNWTVTDTNLNKLWYFYNKTSPGTRNMVIGATNSTNFTLLQDWNYLEFFANDTIGNQASATRNWTYLFVQDNVSYSNATTATATETFVLNGTKGSDVSSVNAVLWYGGTSYSVTATTSGNNVTLASSIDIPGGATSYPFFWQLSIINSTGTYQVNTSTYTQYVTNLSFTTCTAPAANQLFLNFSTLDITNKIPVNSIFEMTIDYFVASGSGAAFESETYSDLVEDDWNYGFCFNSSNNLTLDATIKYDATGFTQNFYYLFDQNLANDNASIDLYLLNDSASTLTEFIVLDASQNPIENVYGYIQYYDVGTDTFYTVSMIKTSYAGKDLSYLNWYDSLYKIVLYKDGEIIKTVNPYKISDTPQKIEITDTSTFEYMKFDDIAYSLIYNNVTQNFVLTFVKPATVDEGCLQVIKRNRTNDYTICDSCESSSSATLYCNIGSAGNGTFISTFYATGSYRDIFDLIQLIGDSNPLYDYIGESEGSALAIITAGTVVAFFFLSPALGVIGMILAVMLTMALGFRPYDYTIMVGIAIIGGLVAWAVRK